MLVQLWSTLKENAPTAALILLILSFIIEITPIKINPWTKILKSISKIVTKDACGKFDGLIIKMDKLENKFDKMEREQIENEKDRIRWEVLDFANSCRNGRKHTRDEFQHIVALNTKYKGLLKQTDDENGVFEDEYNYIHDIYDELKKDNNFLR